MTTQCLWLGTNLKEEEYKEAEQFLNEVLAIKSVKITGTKEVEDLAIVSFNIEDDSELSIAAINRLKTNDIKWLEDYPDINSENLLK